LATPRGRRSQEDRSAATKSALVAAALPLFAAEGYAALRTETIVAAAGVTRGALYHHFADKTALFEAVVEAVEADVTEQLTRQVAASGAVDPIDMMRQAANAWMDACVDPNVARIVLVDGPSVLGWARWREICQRHAFGLVRQLLAQAMDVGRIPSQPIGPLTHLLMGASDEAALYVATATDQDVARREMSEALDQLITGIASGS
jgi:AcrR family transcriptional regulator